MELGTAVSEFLAELVRRNSSASTLRSYKADYREFVEAMPAGAQAADIDVHRIRAWLSSLMDRELSRHTIRNKLGAVRSMFDYLVRTRVLPFNPARRVKTPKDEPPLPRVLPEADVHTLLDGALDGDVERRYRARDAAILELLYGAGLRVAELAALDVCEINLTDRMARVKGKGKIERLAPFTSKARDAIALYLPDRFAAAGEEALITNRFGRRMTTAGIRDVVKFWSCFVNGDSSVHPHLFRHAFATHLLNSGANLREIQELLGHQSLRGTQVYTQVSTRHIEEVYDRCHPRGPASATSSSGAGSNMSNWPDRSASPRRRVA